MMKFRGNKNRVGEKKSGWWLILYMIIGAIIGGCIGALGANVGVKWLVDGIDMFMNKMAFEIYVGVTLPIFILGLFMSVYGIKKFRESLQREDDLYDETLMSVALGLISVSTISAFVLLIPFVGTAINNPHNINSLFSLVVLLGVSILGAIVQNRLVEEIKKGYPEKRGDVYSLKFQKDWISSFDEREKAIAHEAGFNSYRITSIVLFVISLLALFISGDYPSNNGLVLTLLIVSVTMQVTYIYYCIRIERNKRK